MYSVSLHMWSQFYLYCVPEMTLLYKLHSLPSTSDIWEVLKQKEGVRLDVILKEGMSWDLLKYLNFRGLPKDVKMSRDVSTSVDLEPIFQKPQSHGLKKKKWNKEFNFSRSYREYSWKLIYIEMDKTLKGQVLSDFKGISFASVGFVIAPLCCEITVISF